MIHSWGPSPRGPRSLTALPGQAAAENLYFSPSWHLAVGSWAHLMLSEPQFPHEQEGPGPSSQLRGKDSSGFMQGKVELNQTSFADSGMFSTSAPGWAACVSPVPSGWHVGEGREDQQPRAGPRCQMWTLLPGLQGR